MNNNISIKKIYFLDENLTFKKCDKCNKELSPFLIPKEEIDEFLYYLFKENELIINEYENNYIVLLCKYCLEFEKKEVL